MAKRDEVFPSKYLKAADLNGKPLVVTIESSPYETMKTKDGEEERKVVLHFKGMKKCMPLNMTNFDSAVDITGEEDSDNWPGHKLELYPTTTLVGSERKACIRIRPPAQRELKGTRKPPPKPAPRPTLAQEMGDEVPFDP